jgi:hypothetical protein
MDSANIEPINTFTLTGSIKKHPKIWAVCSMLWVYSCFLVWKFEVRALEHISRGERVMYTTPKTSHSESTTTAKDRQCAEI